MHNSFKHAYNSFKLQYFPVGCAIYSRLKSWGFIASICHSIVTVVLTERTLQSYRSAVLSERRDYRDNAGPVDASVSLRAGRYRKTSINRREGNTPGSIESPQLASRAFTSPAVGCKSIFYRGRVSYKRREGPLERNRAFIHNPFIN